MSTKNVQLSAAELDGLLLQADEQVIRDCLAQLRALINKKSKPDEIQSALENLHELWTWEPDKDFPEMVSIQIDGPMLDAMIFSPPDHPRLHLSALRRIIRQASDPRELEKVAEGIEHRVLSRAVGFSNMEIALGVKGARRRERQHRLDNDPDSTVTAIGE
jgi:hypothetical protein